MEFGIFGGADAQAEPSVPPGWPRKPRYATPDLLRKIHHEAFEMYELADDLGLDFLTVSEHHYGGPGMEPNPHLMAAALAPRVSNAKIALLGPNVPMNNPIRIAEEVMMLDSLTDGRIYAVALLRGTPNETVTYFSNPAESREIWEESVELILRAWSEPEPFGWEGIHHRYRTIAVWPRALDPSGPRVMLSGNSFDSVDFAVRMGADLAMSYGSPESTAKAVAHFHAQSAARGRTVTPANVLYRNFVYVAETEEQAIEDCQRYGFGSMNFFKPPSQGAAKVLGEIVSTSYASEGMTKELATSLGKGWGVPRFIGTPDQVFAMIETYHRAGVGAIDFSFGGFGLPVELARKNLEFFCREVLPEARRLPTTTNQLEPAASS